MYADPHDPRLLEKRRAHYHNNKRQYLDRNAAVKLKIREHLQQVKSVPCMDCGKIYPYYVMDFDHRPGEVKVIDPSRLPNYGSWKKVLAEIAKCDVVCSNCPRIRTYERNIGAAVGKPGSLQNSCQIGFDS